MMAGLSFSVLLSYKFNRPLNYLGVIQGPTRKT